MYWEGAKGGEGSTWEAIEQGARDKGHLASRGEYGELIKREPQICGRSDIKRIWWQIECDWEDENVPSKTPIF